MKGRRSFVFFCISFALTANAVWAQSVGTLRGRVTGPAGETLAGRGVSDRTSAAAARLTAVPPPPGGPAACGAFWAMRRALIRSSVKDA
jgi:hypothetical protein